jgi:signal peptidase I
MALFVLAVLTAGCLETDIAVPNGNGSELLATPDGEKRSPETVTTTAQPDRYRIVGDSMAPTLSAGDVVRVNRSMNPEPGDVITYRKADGTVVTHRISFWVAAGENWYDRANASHLGPRPSCSETPMCPAPNAGWVTLGDNNALYDQVEPDDPHLPVTRSRVIGVVAGV